MHDLRHKIARSLTDGCDLDGLMSYFYEGQLEWLSGLDEKEVENVAKEFGLDYLLED